jgi:hypothetical protein
MKAEIEKYKEVANKAASNKQRFELQCKIPYKLWLDKIETQNNKKFLEELIAYSPFNRN